MGCESNNRVLLDYKFASQVQSIKYCVLTCVHESKEKVSLLKVDDLRQREDRSLDDMGSKSGGISPSVCVQQAKLSLTFDG